MECSAPTWLATPAVSLSPKEKIRKGRGAAVQIPLPADMSTARRNRPGNRIIERISGYEAKESKGQGPSLDPPLRLPPSPCPRGQDPEGIGTWTLPIPTFPYTYTWTLPLLCPFPRCGKR